MMGSCRMTVVTFPTRLGIFSATGRGVFEKELGIGKIRKNWRKFAGGSGHWWALEKIIGDEICNGETL